MSNKQLEVLRLAEVQEREWSAPNPKEREQTASELRRLHLHEQALNEWLDKTKWIQDTACCTELGMHRADVMRRRIEQADAREKYLSEQLEQKDKEIEYLVKVIASYHSQYPEVLKTLSGAFSDYGRWVGSQ